MPIKYEWCREYLDEHGDIAEVDFADKLVDLPVLSAAVSGPARICLVRNHLDSWGDVEDRSWAYIEGGALQVEFDSGHRVPQKFHREFSKWHGDLA